MRTLVLATCSGVLAGVLGLAQTMALVPSTAIPNPGTEISFQVTGAPAGAQFRWDFNGDGRPDATTNQPWASWTVPAGYWEVTVEVVQNARVLSRLSAAVAANAQLGAFRVARWNAGALEVTVTLFAKQSLVAPALTETVPPGWAAVVVDDGGAVYRRGDVLEVLWSTYLDPGMAVQIVYALYPPSAAGSSARLSGTASAYQAGRRIEARIAGVVSF
ncbi:MAG: hypothetical protein BIP78_1038 [Candidatus Bipolaricaulis sibiricus]|uniref:PKD domain-containing protein n=1 Tax=Bipolaricaulis sibiricus TaxID=2501609 RepID=A0A410FUX7_BIPS1|nr:MAG: hypothetical protein BIP78_1038 [Candidatus Bipolaricaulis sibiricus]